MHGKATFRTGLNPFAVYESLLSNQGWIVKLDLFEHTVDEETSVNNTLGLDIVGARK